MALTSILWMSVTWALIWFFMVDIRISCRSILTFMSTMRRLSVWDKSK